MLRPSLPVGRNSKPFSSFLILSLDTSPTSRLQRQRMLPDRRFRRITERRHHRLAFIPIFKLIRVVAACQLPAFSSGNHHQRIVPVSHIRHHPHRRPVTLSCRPRTERRPALRLAGYAEYFFQPTFASQRMQHLQRIESLPLPVFDSWTARFFLQIFHRIIRRCHQQFIVVLISCRQPRCRPLRQHPLQKRRVPPSVKLCFVAQHRPQNQLQCLVPRRFQKRNHRRIRVRNSVPILCKSNQLLRTRVLRDRNLRRRCQLFRNKHVRVAVSIRLHLQHIRGPQIVLVVHQIPDPRRPVRFFPVVRQIRNVVRPHHPRIRGHDQSVVRIQRLRQFLKRNVTFPFVQIRIAWYRHLAVSLLSNRHSRRHHIPDISFDVGIHHVLRWPPHSLYNFTKLFPVLRFSQPVISIRKPARLRCRPP